MTNKKEVETAYQYLRTSSLEYMFINKHSEKIPIAFFFRSGTAEVFFKDKTAILENLKIDNLTMKTFFESLCLLIGLTPKLDQEQVITLNEGTIVRYQNAQGAIQIDIYPKRPESNKVILIKNNLTHKFP